jgi:hypothetical protein
MTAGAGGWRRGLRAAAVGAALAATLVVTLFIARSPPAFALSLVGIDGRVALVGGAELVYLPPDGADPALVGEVLEVWAARFGGSADPVGNGAFRMRLAGLTTGDIEDLRVQLTRPGLEIHEVVSDHPVMREVYRRASAEPDPEVEAEVDGWTPDSGDRQTDYFLQAATRAALERYITERVPGGFRPAPGLAIALERSVRGPTAEATWRTYLIDDAVLLDGSMVANAIRSYDQYTNQPIVLVDFTREGGERFAEITTRLVGKKLATMVGGLVQSAPIINGPIRGGRASITMGGIDATEQEEEANDLVGILRAGPLPPGGRILEYAEIAPTATPAKLWLARAITGLVVGALAFVVILLLARETSPIARASGPATRRPPWVALAVTLGAPLVLLVLDRVNLPTIERTGFMEMPAGPRAGMSMFALGLVPLCVGFVAVELVAAAVPAWRPLRLTPAGRRKLGVATVLVGMVMAVLQALPITSYLEMQNGRLNALESAPMDKHVLVATSLAGGTLLLGLLAAVISTWGLANGFGVLFAAGAVIATLRPRVSDWWTEEPALASSAIPFTIAFVVVVAVIVGWWLTRRVTDRRGEHPAPPVIAPVAGLVPILWVFAIVALTPIALHVDAVQKLLDHAIELQGSTVALAIIGLGLCVGLGWLWARPGPAAALAQRIGGAPVRPAWRSWAIAVALSVVVLTALGVMSLIAIPYVWRPAVLSVLVIGSVTAVLLDAVAEWRARRRADLVGVWPIHQVGMVEAAAQVLARAGITPHLRSRHYRTLFGFFAPWAPVEVMVPRERAGEAVTILKDAFDPKARGVVSAW